MKYPSVNDDLEERLGVNVRRLRERAGLSQTALGVAVGLPQSTVSQIEAGRQWVSWSSLKRLASVLGSTPDKLLAPNGWRRSRVA